MADRRRRILAIESKTFEVSDTRNSLEIVEKSQGGWNTYIRFSNHVGNWIVNQFSALQKKRDDFIGRIKERDMVVVINKRRNVRGGFVSMVFVSQNFKRGTKTIIVPQGDESSGWKGFSDIMESVLVREKGRYSVEQVLFIDGFENRVESLGKFAVVAVMENLEKWRGLPEVLKGIFALSKLPVINQIGTKTFLLFMGNEKDVDLLLKVPILRLTEGSISIFQWRPNASILPFEWLQTQDRWIELDGIPVHLSETAEVAKKICMAFGKIKQMEPVIIGEKGLSSMRVLISMCDLTRMSRVIIFKDQSVSYPVRTRLVEIEGEIVREKISGREYDLNPDTVRPADQTTGCEFQIRNLHAGEVAENQVLSFTSPSPPTIVEPTADFLGKDLVTVSTISSPSPFIIIPSHLSIPPTSDLIRPTQSFLTTQPIPHTGGSPLSPIIPSLSFPTSPTLSPMIMCPGLPNLNSTHLQHFPPLSSPTPISSPSLVQSICNPSFNVDGHSNDRFDWANDLDTIDFSDKGNRVRDFSSCEDDEIPDKGRKNQLSFMGLLENMVEIAAHSGLNKNREEVTLPVFQSASAEDDGLVSDSGDDSDHLPEEEFVPMIVHDPYTHADSIASAVAEIHKILGLNVDNTKKSDPSFTKRERGIGTRLKRKKKRAALLLKAEEMIAIT